MKLKELLQKYGIKQKWLASSLGVSDNQVSRWVTGKQYPQERYLNKIMKLLRRRSPVKIFGIKKPRSDKKNV